MSRLCNGYKNAAIDAIDPASGKRAPLYNPRQDDWATHFAWGFDGITMIGMTPTGRATIARLRLNRPEVRLMRQMLPVIPSPE